MIRRIDETVPMNELPTWLQELWELDSALARRAEKHYLELRQVKISEHVLDCTCPRCGSKKESVKDELCMYCIHGDRQRKRNDS